MLFSVNPWLWSATGWDCVDGAGIAYCLLTVALLTWAALRPGRRWALVAAGMALACLVYTNLYWVTMAWLLPAGYIALVWVWHRTPPLRSFLALCAWFGAGCATVTVALGAVNWFLDGHFFFYAPSVTRGSANPPRPGGLVRHPLDERRAGPLAVVRLRGRRRPPWRFWRRDGAIGTTPKHRAGALLGAVPLRPGLDGLHPDARQPGARHLLLRQRSVALHLPGDGRVVLAAGGVPFNPRLGAGLRRLRRALRMVWLDGVGHRPGAIPHAALAGIAALALSLLLRRRAAGSCPLAGRFRAAGGSRRELALRRVGPARIAPPV